MINNIPKAYTFEDVVDKCFLQADGSIWVYADPTAKQVFRREDRDVSKQKRVKLIPTNNSASGAASLTAIEFALHNGRLNDTPILRNDAKKLVEVPQNVFKLFNTGGKKNTHVNIADGKKRANPWMVRFQKPDGTRYLKASRTKETGTALFKSQFEKVWRTELEKYNLWNTYVADIMA